MKERLDVLLVSQGLAVIMVSSELPEVMGMADRIIVMHEGKIVERGKHEELLALKGYYKKLTDMQSL